MKRWMTVLAFVLAGAGSAFAGDPVAGVWQTAPGDSGGWLHVKIAPCGQKICGTIVRAFKKGGVPDPKYANLGKPIIWDMVPEGDGTYAGGKVWAPDRDKVYRSKMQLHGGQLTVKGCVLGGLICRGQEWKRVE